jgi:predicted nuclease of predicted toxin-antitoxin system
LAEARFLLDEHMPNTLARGLRERGIDAVTVGEIGRRRSPDPEHLPWAREHGRVIVTHDEDFLVLAKRMPPFAGIAYCHSTKYAVGQLVLRIEALAEEMANEDWANRVVYL